MRHLSTKGHTEIYCREYRGLWGLSFLLAIKFPLPNFVSIPRRRAGESSYSHGSDSDLMDRFYSFPIVKPTLELVL